jgi:hypothetical protein
MGRWAGLKLEIDQRNDHFLKKEDKTLRFCPPRSG